MVETVAADVEVDVSARTAYERWMRIEEYPTFMREIESVTVIDPLHSRWVVDLGGRRCEFEIVIVDQHPDLFVAWRSFGTPIHAGGVSFVPLLAERTRISLVMHWDAAAVEERTGASLNPEDLFAATDLMRFKRLVEAPEPLAAHGAPVLVSGGAMRRHR